MTRIKCSFPVAASPEQAQQMFLRDIAPELARDGGFQLAGRRDGLLRFSDGMVDVDEIFDPYQAAEPDEIGHQSEREEMGRSLTSARRPASHRTGVGLGPNVVSRRPWLYVTLSRLTARRIKVRFTAEGLGAGVSITGSAEKPIARGLKNLGQPGHWPETASQPHD